MEFIAVDYNQSLKPLETLLLRITRGGDFYAAGTIELPMPRVEVDSIGPLSFPIPQDQIDALVRHAQRAPYGKGLDTIIDTAVRKVCTRRLFMR